jgi:hypothetical protein
VAPKACAGLSPDAWDELPRIAVREASGAMTPERRRVAIIVVAVILALILISGLALLLISPD